MLISIINVKIISMATGVIFYFRRREVYQDDNKFDIYYFPGKSLPLFHKDILAVTGIICSSIVIAPIITPILQHTYSRVYDCVDKKIDQIRSRKLVLRFENVEPDISDVDIITAPSETSPSTAKVFIKQLLWLGVATGVSYLIYYYGQRIEITPANLTPLTPSKPSFDFDQNSKAYGPFTTLDADHPAMLQQTDPLSFGIKPNVSENIGTESVTSELNWWDRMFMEPWMLNDITNDDNRTITRDPYIPKDYEIDKIPEIVSSHPRRIVVQVNAVLQFGEKHKDPKTGLPLWFFSPAYAFLRQLYTRINK